MLCAHEDPRDGDILMDAEPIQSERDRISRVLIVEDDSGQRMILSRIIEKEGYHVSSCSTGSEALDEVRRHQFGVAVVDYRLPDINGTQLCERIRGFDDSLPVIIHTAFGTFDSAKESVNSGAFAYVEKTIDSAPLMHHVHRAFREQLHRYAGDLESAVAQRTAALTEANRALRQEIEERERAEQALRESAAQLRHAQKMEAMGTLAAGIAHDFNNLLTAILGYVEMARFSLSGQEGAVGEAIAHLDGIEKAVDQATNVTQSLLTFSRKAPIQKSPVHLGRLVEETSRLLRRMIPAVIDIEIEVPADGELWIEGDATHLQQVLINLAVNARDALVDGGRLRIAVRSGEAADADAVEGAAERRALLIVEDNGTGMSEETLARLFEPFYTTKPRERGTGLGMAVVHGLIVEHGGSITVTSAVGEGTRITVSLPTCPPPGDPQLDKLSDEVVREGSGETVMIVEDNPHILSLITSALAAGKYRCITGRDGHEAMRIFEAHREHARLAIIDLDLPEMGGLACLEQLRGLRPDIPAIIITGSAELDPNKPLGDGVRFLRKPFRLADLTRIVSDALNSGSA